MLLLSLCKPTLYSSTICATVSNASAPLVWPFLPSAMNTLLERIVLEARSFTSADAGTLYLLQGDLLHFEIAHNDTLGLRQGGQDETLDVPPVPLDKNSASGYVAVTGEVLNIADVYDDPDFDFEGPKQYDRLTGYLTQSMLVLPMTDHEGRVIGVLQLINAIGDGEIIPFSLEEEVLIRSLASQAAVAINNRHYTD
jgi:GAF domain-containing protein